MLEMPNIEGADSPGELTYLKQFGLVVVGVDSILRVAGIAEKLSTVVGNWSENKRTIGQLLIRSVLPLHDPLGASRILRIGNGPEVGRFEEAVCGERV